MRDIVWTLILIWLVYKLSEIFRKKTSGQKPETQTYTENTMAQNTARTNTALKKKLDTEGEYVDFEELKS